jgi:integrase
MRHDTAIQVYNPGPPVPTGSTKTEPLSQSDYERIKAHLPEYKYLLLTKVLRNTGLREAEVMRRTAEYFYQDGPFHFIRTTRGKKKGEPVWEDVALHPEVGLEVQAYIKGNGIRPGQLVFAFTPRQYQRVFREASLQAIHRPAKPHQLRHLYTKTLVDGGVPIAVAQKMLGHEDEKTTLKHYYDLTREERSEIARRMPV